MKARKEHRVPLSTGAIKILQELPRVAGGHLVFPGQQGKQMSDMTLTAVPREVIEHALAHKLKDQAEAAYQRGYLLQKRRLLMENWCLASISIWPNT